MSLPWWRRQIGRAGRGGDGGKSQVVVGVRAAKVLEAGQWGGLYTGAETLELHRTAAI